MRIRGARALVTGASSGIGRAVAIALADGGCRLLLTGRDAGRLADAANLTGADTVAADLRVPGDVSRLVRAATAARLDLVVHCAGIGHAAPAADQDDDELLDVLSTNLVAPMRLTKALLPALMADGGGRLVFVTSIAGLLGVAGESTYSASKAALTMYAESLRAELSGRIGVTIVAPGAVDTPFFTSRGSPYRRRFPRAIAPDGVAAALVRAVRDDRAQAIVPGWLRAAAIMRACAPQAYARLARRWG